MTRTQYDELSAPLVRTMLDMEDDILREIAAQLSRDENISDTSKWRIRQLARAGRFDKRAASLIAGYSEVQNEQAMDMILAAAETEIGYLDEAVRAANTAGLSEYFSDIPAETSALNAAKAFQKQAASDMNLVNTVMQYKAKAALIKAVNDTYLEGKKRQQVLDTMGKHSASLVMGQMSLQQATRRCIKELAQKGIPAFVDKSGREWSPEAYVMMDMRSTLGNTARAAQDMRCDQYGISLISVSSHMGARPLCALYQGRIFSRDGTSGVTMDGNGREVSFSPLSETSYGLPAGLFGINCGHVQYPFIPGINIQRYFPYPEEENSKRYEQLQRQRYLERQIRATKRECMMLNEVGDKEGLQKASLRLRNQRSQYRQFCKGTGLREHGDRTQVLGFDRSVSSKTVWAERKAQNLSNSNLKPLDNGGGSGIIGVGRSDVLQQAKTRDTKIEITEIAVSKATPPNIPHFSQKQNQTFKQLHHDLLSKAMLENDSNEVAFLFNPTTLKYEFELGDINSVNVFNNPFAVDMLKQSSERELFLLHNHPTTKSFSYSDIGVFLLYDNIGGITVVTNAGKVDVIYKTEHFDFGKAYLTLKQIRSEYSNKVLTETEDAEVVKRFLKDCGTCGI